MKKNKHFLRGILFTLSGGIAWGFSGSCGQVLLQHENIPSSVITAIRMLFAGIILVIFNISKRKKDVFYVFKDKTKAVKLLMFSVFGLLLSQFTYLKTISYSNAGTATVLQYIGPVFIMIYVCLSTRRLPEISEAAALLAAMAGVVLIATHGRPGALSISKECLFWGLLSALGLMLYSLLPKSLIEERGAVEISGWGMLIGGLIMAAATRLWSVEISSFAAVGALLAMVFIGTVFAYTAYLQGVGDIGAENASVIACVEPVSAAVFSHFWLGTRFFPADIIGFIFIISSVIILGMKKRK